MNSKNDEDDVNIGTASELAEFYSKSADLIRTQLSEQQSSRNELLYLVAILGRLLVNAAAQDLSDPEDTVNHILKSLESCDDTEELGEYVEGIRQSATQAGVISETLNFTSQDVIASLAAHLKTYTSDPS